MSILYLVIGWFLGKNCKGEDSGAFISELPASLWAYIMFASIGFIVLAVSFFINPYNATEYETYIRTNDLVLGMVLGWTVFALIPAEATSRSAKVMIPISLVASVIALGGYFVLPNSDSGQGLLVGVLIAAGVGMIISLLKVFKPS